MNKLIYIYLTFSTLLCILIFTALPHYAYAQKPTFPDITARVVRVIDGDTIVVTIAEYPPLIGKKIIDGDTIVVTIAEYPPLIGKKISVRLAGCNTPELTAKDKKARNLAQKAKQFVQKQIPVDTKIILKNVQRGKYFRIIADIVVNGKQLAPQILELGLAEKYPR